MQVPQRRSQRLRIQDEMSYHLTAEGLARLQRQLVEIEHELPQAREDVVRLARFGDFSENAEYQDAKHRLRRLNDRVESLKHRISRAIVIEANGNSGTIQLGSTVKVVVNEKEKTFHIVGPQESNPLYGRISHVSPLGAALIGHAVGETVTFNAPGGPVTYQITSIE